MGRRGGLTVERGNLRADDITRRELQSVLEAHAAQGIAPRAPPAAGAPPQCRKCGGGPALSLTAPRPAHLHSPVSPSITLHPNLTTSSSVGFVIRAQRRHLACLRPAPHCVEQQNITRMCCIRDGSIAPQARHNVLLVHGLTDSPCRAVVHA